ncbi:MAG: hypothetical protein ACFC1C_01130 [Candidatus Malihini olakiniferum]
MERSVFYICDGTGAEYAVDSRFELPSGSYLSSMAFQALRSVNFFLNECRTQFMLNT